jgi:hypothetical protein|tara:strand:+ start:168 stop:332 length:165 start_codon:yes stop_codon:yes gene_type:complete
MIRVVRKFIVKLRMKWADIRGHHGKKWDYEAGEFYMGIRKSKKYGHKFKSKERM